MRRGEWEEARGGGAGNPCICQSMTWINNNGKTIDEKSDYGFVGKCMCPLMAHTNLVTVHANQLTVKG